MKTEETYQIYGDLMRFEFAPGGGEGRDYFKLIIKDGHLWVDSAFLYRPPFIGVSVDGIPIPDQIARQVIKTVFPLSKWDIEQQQYLMVDGPHLELLCSDWGGRGVWLRGSNFSHEAAWEVVNKVYELCPLSEIDRHRDILLFQKTEINEEGTEELQRICKEVLAIEEGLLYGIIPFEKDNSVSAPEPGHPMDVLDEMLTEIFWDVQAGKEPSLEALKSTLNSFKRFRKIFKGSAINGPIRHLATYIKAKEAEDIASSQTNG